MASGPAAIRFDDDGLVPCVLQDWRTGEVLTLAYMNEEALERTRETGEVHFWSRSRDELWHKGETSGNVQRLRQLRYDCDGDAIVALVEPAGPACHTGERSCFYRDLEGGAGPSPTRRRSPASRRPPRTRPCRRSSGRSRSESAIVPRAPTRSSSSAIPSRIGDKVREEADEVARAAAGESDERLAEEAADVLYHLEVLMLSRDVPLAAAMERLNARRG